MTLVKAPTKREKQTWQYYERYATEYTARRTEDFYFWKPEIEKFHNLLPSGKILEIGSGGGHEAKQLIKIGYDYTGIDVSINLLRIAKNENPTGTFLNRSVYEIDLPSKSFDGFWTAATLLHIPKTRIYEALSNIHFLLKPGAIGFISLGKGNTEEIEESTGRYIAFYQLNEFRKILAESHFKVLENNIIDENTRLDNAENVKWITYFVKT
jgi:SAM-dependent methyltransferase